MKKTISFTLSKNGKAIGQIHWEREFYHKRGFELPVEQSGNLKGSAEAVAILKENVNRAIVEEWQHLKPKPCSPVITDPLTFDTEMVSVFHHAGFDIPPEFDETVKRMKRPANTYGIRY